MKLRGRANQQGRASKREDELKSEEVKWSERETRDTRQHCNSYQQEEPLLLARLVGEDFISSQGGEGVGASNAYGERVSG